MKEEEITVVKHANVDMAEHIKLSKSQVRFYTREKKG